MKRRWEDMTGTVKKKEREARNKELKRLRVTGNGNLEDEVGKLPNVCYTWIIPHVSELFNKD